MYEVSQRKRAKFQGCPNCPRPQTGFWEFGIGTTPHKKIYLICHTCGWQTKPTRTSKGMWKQYEKAWIKRRKMKPSTTVDCKGCMNSARIQNEKVNGLFCLLNGKKIEDGKPLVCPARGQKKK